MTDPVEVSYGEALKRPKDPEKPGCKFDGWYTDREKRKLYDFESPVFGDMVLYAKWEYTQGLSKITHTLTFNGYVDTFSVTVGHGHIVRRPPDPERPGYDFLGWYTGEEIGHESMYYLFDTPVTQDLVLWDGWKEATRIHIVSFNTCIDPNPTSSVEVRDGEALKRPKDPVKPGCRLVGWYADREKTKLYNFLAPVVSDMVLYAKWEYVMGLTKMTHNITFSAYFGSDSAIVRHGQTVERPPDPEMPGYDFTGWYLGEGGNDESLYYLFDTPVTQDMVLWAAWEAPIMYEVSFNTSVQPHTTYNMHVRDGEAVEKPEQDPEKPYCKFVGWYTDTAKTKLYDFKSPVFNDMVLYAKWELIQSFKKEFYTIIFDGNPVTVLHGQTVVPPALKPRRGYVFLGWYTADIPIEAWRFLLDTPVTQDLILYEFWEEADIPTIKILHTVTFANSDIPPVRVSHGRSVVRPDDPKRKGYKFLGWYPNEGPGRVEFDFAQPIIMDTTIYARWTADRLEPIRP